MAVRVQIGKATRGGDRALDARAANDRIAEKARRLHFVSGVPMLCECSAPDCRTIVMIALPDYRAIRSDPAAFLAAPGHDADGTELASATSTYTVRRHGRRDVRGGRRSA